MRMRAGFISNSSTSSFVIFFGAPPAKKAGRGKKATAATSSSEPSPDQWLKTAVDGAMESGWLDPLLKELHEKIDNSYMWKQVVKGEDEEEEEEEEGGNEEEEVKEPEAKKSRKDGEQNGKELKKRSAREEKRWAAMRAMMTQHLISARPQHTAEHIEGMAKLVDSMREDQDERRRERRRERRERLGEDEDEEDSDEDLWFCGGDDSYSDQETENRIKDIEKQITFAKRVQSKKQWCVEYSCSNQDGDMCEEAMHDGMMRLNRRSGKHLAVFGINNE